jgi:hypothetical protein
VNADTTSAALARCHCHEWHTVADIGSWLVRPGVGDLLPARDWAQAGIWRDRCCALGGRAPASPSSVRQACLEPVGGLWSVR